MSGNQKHLSLEDRICIQNSLKNNLSFKAISRLIDKDCTTISKEVRKNSIEITKSHVGRHYNPCIHAKSCTHKNDICSVCKYPNTTKLCRMCSGCWNLCNEFVLYQCPSLLKAPYVCNGCSAESKCTVTKRMYMPSAAQNMYKERLSECRSGIVITEEEIQRLNKLLTPLIKNQGQSIHHVYIHHKDEIMMSEKTLYKIIDENILDIRNIDLPRKIRYRKRKNSKSGYKVDTACLQGRKYEDFLQYMKEHPDTSIVEMDTVEGKKGESCILTLHFVSYEFMIGIKRESNDSKSVTSFFNAVAEGLGNEVFKKLFPVILTDNGSEFSNPKAIEFDEEGNRRCYVFYCHPSSPYEKGACEVNHELLRRIIPKSVSMNQYNKNDINTVMSHINSYGREKLNNVSPYFLFTSIFSKEIADFFGISYVKPDDIILKPSLISK